MYQMPVKALKSLLGKELAEHYQAACQTIHHEVQRTFIHRGYHLLKNMLDASESYDEIQEVLNLADYRMSIQEWINSL